MEHAPMSVKPLSASNTNSANIDVSITAIAEATIVETGVHSVAPIEETS